MAIPEEDIARVREATDITAVVGEYTALKRVGRRFVGLCPFHSERTPSFSVNAEEGFYYCFGCQASGDAISFVRAIEHCDFVEAVERLAAKAGITVRNDAAGQNDASRRKRQGLYDALEAAAAFYHRRLLESDDARAARGYLRGRGYDGDVVREFRLGFAPSSYDALARSLRLPADVLREAGLTYTSQRGSLVDVMRERVIFPIMDPMGKVIALGGRVLPDELRTTTNPGPKYRNSPESPIYSKSSTLYGMNFAKADVATSGEVVVCEGYTDVIGFHLAGIPRAVATCGTSLTEQHFRLLGRFARRVVLSFDADRAGQNAAARLYEFERRHEVELFVAALPQGADPADLARRDPAALAAAIASARPFLGFRVDRAIAAEDLSSPEGRARAATAAVAAIAEHPSDLVRDQYVVEVADRTRHDPERLRAMLTAQQASRESSDGAPPGPRSPVTAPVPREAVARAGRDALLLAIHRPADVADWIDEELFADPVQRAALRALLTADELHEAIERADPEPADLLRRLVVIDGTDEIDADGTLFELARAAATRVLRSLEADARLHADDDAALTAATSAIRDLKADLELLRDPPEVAALAPAVVDAAHRILGRLRDAHRVGE